MHPHCTSDDFVSIVALLSHRLPGRRGEPDATDLMYWQETKVSRMNVDHIELHVQQNQLDQQDVTKVVEIVENVEHREMGEQQECQDKLEQKALQDSRPIRYMW